MPPVFDDKAILPSLLVCEVNVFNVTARESGKDYIDV